MPPALAIGGLAAAGAASNVIGANQAKQAEKGKQGQINSIMAGLTPEIQQLYASAIGNAQLGYDQAIGSLSGYGSKAKADIGTQAAQSGASLSEEATSKGLGSSSYLLSLKHGIGLQAAKAKSGVDENVAALIGNLLKQKGLSTANLLQSQAGLQANIGVDYASILSKLSPPSHAGLFSALGGGFNALGQGALDFAKPDLSGWKGGGGSSSPYYGFDSSEHGQG